MMYDNQRNPPGVYQREIIKTRAQLLESATAGNKPVGDKWGGKHLCAPESAEHET